MKKQTGDLNIQVDQDTEDSLHLLETAESFKANRIQGVRTVLVVLSSAAMVFDTEALRQKIILAYPDTAIFFRSTNGKALGVSSPRKVDLLIDLTGPGQVG